MVSRGISPQPLLLRPLGRQLLLHCSPLSMATITSFLSKPLHSLLPNCRIIASTSSAHSFLPTPFSTPNRRQLLSAPLRSERSFVAARAIAASPDRSTTKPTDEWVKKVHSAEEFDEALRAAKDRLVVVEYAASHSANIKKIYSFMVGLSHTCGDVDFLLVMGDESEKTRELYRREKIEKVPHFSFYKSMEKVHEEEAIGPDRLRGDVLYYGNSHSAVEQLHCREDVEKLIYAHRVDGKLVVLDAGLKHCGPCVKVYSTVIKLSRQMADTVVFVRMNGDENGSYMGS